MVGEGENRVKEYFYNSFPAVYFVGWIANTLPINQKIVTVSLQFKDVASGTRLNYLGIGRGGIFPLSELQPLSQLSLQSESKRPGIISKAIGLPKGLLQISKKVAITAQVWNYHFEIWGVGYILLPISLLCITKHVLLNGEKKILVLLLRTFSFSFKS